MVNGRDTKFDGNVGQRKIISRPKRMVAATDDGIGGLITLLLLVLLDLVEDGQQHRRSTPAGLLQNIMRAPSQFWILFLHFVRVAASTPLPTDEHGDYNGADLIEWVRSHPEGEVHPSLRIGRERPGDPSSIHGLFVASDGAPIERGDVIARIPWDHLIHPDGKYQWNKYFSCRAIYNLAKELRLGERSKRAPYVRYLLTMPRGTMPGEWSAAGKRFLADMLGGEFPPWEETWRTKFEDEWIEGCSADEDDETERAAYWLASSRDEDTLMVPIYDMANHSNDPKKLNTLSYKPSEAGDAFRLVANAKILPGEQVYNSYNRCNPCSEGVDAKQCETFSFWRTPDLFVRFGFVEDYPRSWEFDPGDDDDSSDDDRQFEVCLQRDEGSGEVEALWDDSDDAPDGADVRWLEVQRKRLIKLHDDKERLEKELVLEEGGEAVGEKMSRYEWESIWRYYEALMQAIDATRHTAREESRWDEL